MNLQLIITTDKYYLFVPDGYISDLHKFRDSFLSWVAEQPDNNVILEHGPRALSFGYNDVLRYINEVLLLDCNEKAYLLGKNGIRQPAKKILKF